MLAPDGTTQHLARPAETGTALPGTLVRKSAPEEVLITDWQRLSGDTHRVVAVWPGSHRFYRPRPDAYSSLLFIETVRQALALLSHTAYHIPLSYRLGWEYCSSVMAPPALWAAREEPAEVELTVTHLAPVQRRSRGSARLAAHIQATREGEPLGAVSIRYTAHPPAIYERLRGAHGDAKQLTAQAPPPTAPVGADQVGRSCPDDVVLSPASGTHRWQLRVDTDHPVLFDHAHDHIPGMVLLEAVDQALQYMAGPATATPVTCRTRFSRYTELDAPCWIEASPLERPQPGIAHTEFSGVQNGQTTFTTRVVACS